MAFANIDFASSGVPRSPDDLPGADPPLVAAGDGFVCAPLLCESLCDRWPNREQPSTNPNKTNMASREFVFILPPCRIYEADLQERSFKSSQRFFGSLERRDDGDEVISEALCILVQ